MSASKPAALVRLSMSNFDSDAIHAWNLFLFGSDSSSKIACLSLSTVGLLSKQKVSGLVTTGYTEHYIEDCVPGGIVYDRAAMPKMSDSNRLSFSRLTTSELVKAVNQSELHCFFTSFIHSCQYKFILFISKKE